MNWKYFYSHYDEWPEGKQIRAIQELDDYGSSFEVSEVALYAPNENAPKELLSRALKAGIVFDPEDICKVDCSVDEEMLEYLINMALQAGKIFSVEQIIELTGLISEDALSEMVLASLSEGEYFSEDQVIELSGLIKGDVLRRLAKQPGLCFTKDQEETIDLYCDLPLQDKCDMRETDSEDPRLSKKAPQMADRLFNAGKREKRPGKLFSALAFGGMLAEGNKKKPSKFRVGDRVRIRYRGQEGTIVDVNGPLYMVSVDNGRHVDSYYENQLERAW